MEIINILHTIVTQQSFNPYAAGGYFGQYKIMLKNLKMTETLANGYSSESAQQDLSNAYQHDGVMKIFNNLCLIVLWTKVTSTLEGLNPFMPGSLDMIWLKEILTHLHPECIYGVKNINFLFLQNLLYHISFVCSVANVLLRTLHAISLEIFCKLIFQRCYLTLSLLLVNLINMTWWQSAEKWLKP